MARDTYYLIRRTRRALRPFDVVEQRVRRAGRNHYRVIETPVRRTITERGALRVARRLNSQEAS